jgi:hypothetical protein
LGFSALVAAVGELFAAKLAYTALRSVPWIVVSGLEYVYV